MSPIQQLKKSLFIACYAGLFILVSGHTYAQDTLRLNLEEILNLSIAHAIDLKIAQSESTEQEWAFERARTRFIPQLFLDGTLPNLNRSIESRPLPDGRDAFVNRSTMYNGIGLDFRYNVEKTGGVLSLNSRLERLDIFKTNEFAHSTNYFVNPISIEYTQPFFTFNELKWEKQRLSLLYTQFQERYARTREDIIIQAINLFKTSHLAQERYNLTAGRIQEGDSTLVIKNRLFDIGKSTKVEILRLSLDQKNANNDLLEQDLSWRQAQMELADFVGVSRNTFIVLEDPAPLQEIEIELSVAMEWATKNKYIVSQYAYQNATNEAELERSKKDRDIQFNLKASLGLNGSNEQLGNIFNPLLDREIFSASIRMPITGLNRYDLNHKIAQEKINQEDLRQEKQQNDLEREAINLVSRFNLLKQSIEAREEARRTADEVFAITRRQFLSGNATHSDMVLARENREQAEINYFTTLLDIIDQYYQIRRLCMYDFKENIELR